MRLALYYILSFILLSSCHFTNGKRIEGNGIATTQERNIGDFTGVSASGSIDIIVTDGPVHSLKVETDENLMDYLEVKNNNGIVKIYSKEDFVDSRKKVK